MRAILTAIALATIAAPVAAQRTVELPALITFSTAEDERVKPVQDETVPRTSNLTIEGFIADFEHLDEILKR